ncbi:hypothetical protein TrRE_jg1165, partial [Triparma retinervis]
MTKNRRESPRAARRSRRHKQEKPQAARRSNRLKQAAPTPTLDHVLPTPTLEEVLPEEALATFALTLQIISEEWKRDWQLAGGMSGQKFTSALANKIARELLVELYGPLQNNLTDEQRERIWELLPGVLVEADGEVKVVLDSDITPDGEAVKDTNINDNMLSGLNALKLLSYLAYVADACPPLVTLCLSDPCDTKLRRAAVGKDSNGKDLHADE